MPSDARPPDSSLLDQRPADSVGESHAPPAENGSQPAQSGGVGAPNPPGAWLAGRGPVVVWFLALMAASALLAWGLQYAGKRLIASLPA